MKTIITLIIGIIIGYVIARSWGNKNQENQQKEEEKKGISKLNQKRAEEKNKRKEKVMEYLKDNGKITNSEIQTLLGVSDSTVTDYLDELEKEGKIRQIGETGSGVYYELA